MKWVVVCFAAAALNILVAISIPSMMWLNLGSAIFCCLVGIFLIEIRRP